MTKKVAGSAIIGIFILAAVFILILINCKNYNKNDSRPNRDQSFLFPGSMLIGMKKDDSGATYITYETHSGNVHEYYKNQLKNGGWNKTENLGESDKTLCGGDWGGIYQQSDIKMKIHICGPTNSTSYKNIFFTLYNIEPEEIFGDNFLKTVPNCVVDAKIKSLEACDSGSNVKFKIVMATDEIKHFITSLRPGIVDSTQNQNGNVELEVPYETPSKYRPNKAYITPVATSAGSYFHCSDATKEVKITRCQQEGAN